MENFDERGPFWQDLPPTPPRSGSRWLLVAGLSLALLLALGAGVLIGTSTNSIQAAPLSSSATSSNQTLVVTQAGNHSFQNQASNPGSYATGPANHPGGGGQCEALTVTSVNGNTIVAKGQNGKAVTIHTSASTRYTQAGKSVAASAIKAGTHVQVMGTHNSDGTITASSIVIG